MGESNAAHSGRVGFEHGRLSFHGRCPQSDRSVLGGRGHEVTGRGELHPGDDVLMTNKAESSRLWSQIPDHQALIQRPRGQLFAVWIEVCTSDSIFMPLEVSLEGWILQNRRHCEFTGGGSSARP